MTTTNTRSSRRAPSRRRGPNPLLLLAIAAVVLAAIAAVVVTALSSDDDKSETNFDTTTATIEGTALTPLAEAGSDPAVGQAAPRIEGLDRDGDPILAPASGRPTVLLFLAHWCPHCQREVPVVQQWIDDGKRPDGVDFVAVATAVDPSRPNYPPSAWLEGEGWTSPTIADASSVAAQAYGMSAFPFWVAVDAQAQVVARVTGELRPAQITALATAALEG